MLRINIRIACSGFAMVLVVPSSLVLAPFSTVFRRPLSDVVLCPSMSCSVSKRRVGMLGLYLNAGQSLTCVGTEQRT